MLEAYPRVGRGCRRVQAGKAWGIRGLRRRGAHHAGTYSHSSSIWMFCEEIRREFSLSQSGGCALNAFGLGLRGTP